MEQLINKFQDLCYKIYPVPLKGNFDIKNQSDFFKFLNQNRLDSFFALEYAKKIQDNTFSIKLGSMIQDYKKYHISLINDLKLTKKILGKNEFIVIKTLSSYPHTTSDLDVIVRDPEIAHYANNKLKMKDNLLLPIDISCKISWTDTVEVSNDFIWKNTRKKTIDNIDFLVPNNELDVLVRIAHIPFELAQIRLGELLHIYSYLDSINVNILAEEAKINRWPKTWKSMLNVILQLKQDLFSSNKTCSYPHSLKYSILLSAVIEKKAWKKILGARYIIMDRLFNLK